MPPISRGLFTFLVLGALAAAQEDVAVSTVTPDVASEDSLVETMNVECTHQDMVVTFQTFQNFHGMVYPRGLSRDSPCLREYDTLFGDSIVYRVPLRSCNTMFTESDEGSIEYFNTIIVQPHRKLVTDQGRGYHVRCTYQNRDNTVISGFNISYVGDAHLKSNSPLPVTTMHIYSGDAAVAAESVRIGDELTLVIALEQQETFGMKVTDCSVRDGLGWTEQQLYNDQGCPLDPELMGPLEYNSNLTRASVRFQAHKFPYTPSVYYQCNVRLCLRHGGCTEMPPLCDQDGNNLRRRKREASGPLAEYRISDPEFAENATIEVFGGFYVTDTIDSKDTRLFTGEPVEEADDGQLCISPRDFAIGIAVAGLILMIAIIAAVLFLCARRRRKHVSSTTGSSVYSGPYTNTAYSHSS